MWSVSFGICLLFHSHALAAETKWRKQPEARLDGQTVDCAFTGGMEFSKPTFVDIDKDGDLDIFVGDKNGRIRFFRNLGTSQNPHWDFVSDFRDSTIAERSFPAFADIDDDGDKDLFVGNREGKICFFRNDGTPNSPVWVRITDFYDSVDVGSESTPAFVDIDKDLDLDLFVGKDDGTISFYRNIGTKKQARWSLVSQTYDSIDVGSFSLPAFVDIDADGDLDLFLGEEQGNVNFYRNVGSGTVPSWDLVSSNYNSIAAGKRSSPVFADGDGDSDFDLFVGNDEGKVLFYRNDGSVHLPSWTKVTENYLFLDVGSYSKPALADIDADGDEDLFVGEYQGNINFFRNQGPASTPAWGMITDSYFAIEADDYSCPTFADIDGDGDLDLFIGKKDGTIDFYENIGNAKSAFWTLVSDQYNSIDVGSYATPAFVDIDHDSDLDLFVGQIYGKVFFYRNDGTSHFPAWTPISENFDSIDVGWYSVPTFGDLDSDGDLDLLVGNEDGKISFYRNDGTRYSHSFFFVADFYDSIDVGERSTPVLGDFDSDGDWDLFVGESEGGLHFYKNVTLNSIRGRVTDGTATPLTNVAVYLSGDRKDTVFTDSSGNYAFVGLPLGNYCVFRDPAHFQYCFSSLSSDTFEINFVGFTEVDESNQQTPSDRFELFPNYPNPFNPSTTITYSLPSDQEVKLTVYNLRGEKVRELVNGFQTRGQKSIIWDGRNAQGKEVATGIYFCRLQAKGGYKTRTMVLVK
ncbi:MAG: FG-GAP-like repeat-containing protein [Candidatus Zixiibacteriota bacterium]